MSYGLFKDLAFDAKSKTASQLFTELADHWVILDNMKLSNEPSHKKNIQKDIIDKVIFNDPATIVYLKNGEKIVVKTMEGDVFDPGVGFAMAMMKYMFDGSGKYKRWIEGWIEKSNSKEVK